MMNFLDNFIKMERDTGSSWEKDNVAIFYYEGDRWAADKIARDILRIYDCSIYLSQYQLVGMEQEELEAILQEMMFSVFVISKNFLTTENSAKDFALQTVLRLGMRFMPVQVESEIEGLFDQKVGAFHLIDSQKDNYEEAMNAYLDSYPGGTAPNGSQRASPPPAASKSVIDERTFRSSGYPSTAVGSLPGSASNAFAHSNRCAPSSGSAR